MNPLFNGQQKGVNFAQMRNQIMDFVKGQIAMGANPEQLKQQILKNNPNLQGMIQRQYGNMSYQDIAKQNGYNVQSDLSQLGL